MDSAPPAKKEKKASQWLNALKEYSKKSGKYVVPKKGTKEYDEVKALQKKLEGGK